MRCLAGALLINIIAMIAITAMTQSSFAQRNNADELSIATWKLGSKTNSDNHIDPIITGNTLTVESVTDWEKRKNRFLECGLCAKIQAFPE